MSRRPSLSQHQHDQSLALGSVAHDKSRKKATTTEAEEVIQTSFRLPRSRWRRLQELSIDQRASVQSIIVAALEREFASRGLTF
jgi:hypothetical protein